MNTRSSTVRDAGVRAYDAGALGQAADLLARAVNANPRDADAWAALGRVYSQKGLHDDARQSLSSAIALEPANCDFRYQLGEALECAGDAAGAAKAYRDALQVAPGHAEALTRLRAIDGAQVFTSGAAG